VAWEFSARSPSLNRYTGTNGKPPCPPVPYCWTVSGLDAPIGRHVARFALELDDRVPDPGLLCPLVGGVSTTDRGFTRAAPQIGLWTTLTPTPWNASIAPPTRSIKRVCIAASASLNADDPDLLPRALAWADWVTARRVQQLPAGLYLPCIGRRA